MLCNICKIFDILLDALPAPDLRLIQEFIRFLYQLIEVCILTAPEFINPNGNFHKIRLLAQTVKAFADNAQILHSRTFKILFFRKYQGNKLIPSNARCNCICRQDFPKLVRYAANGKIPGRMAITVIDFFEVVQITKYEKRFLSLSLLAATDRTLHKAPAVQKLRQLVIL